MNPYQQLEQHFKKYYDFENLAAIVSWDEATMMPAGGGQARAEALATLSAVQHEWLTNKKVGDWIKQAKDLPGYHYGSEEISIGLISNISRQPAFQRN